MAPVSAPTALLRHGRGAWLRSRGYGDLVAEQSRRGLFNRIAPGHRRTCLLGAVDTF